MHVFRRLKFGFIAIAVVTVVLFVFGMFFSLEKANVMVPTSSSLIFYTDRSHPAVLVFPERYDTPAIPEQDAWFETVMDSIQSSYRAYGIRSGLLESGIFVEFSTSILKKAISSLPLTKDPSNLTALDFAELFRSNESLVKFLAPRALSDTLHDMSEVDRLNPIKVEVLEMNWAMTMNDMRQLITEGEQPLLLTIPQPLARYNVDGRVVEFESVLPNGQFFNPQPPAVLVPGKPLTMLLYGWNDDISTYMLGVRASRNTTYGGMVVKPPRGPKGLPIGVYDQTLDIREAERFCGQQRVPCEWTEDLILRCKDATYCDPNYNYTMYAVNWEGGSSHFFEDQPDGTSKTKMWKLVGTEKELVTISGIPYHFLGNAFEPAEPKGGHDEYVCNFWFLPYDLLENLIRITAKSSNCPIVISTAWKWAKESYQRKELIIKSMKSMSPRPTSTFP